MNWVRKQNPAQPRDTTYEVVLPQSRIALTYGVPRAEPDFLTLQLQNTDGVTVDSWSVDEPDYDPERENAIAADPDGNWTILYKLFSEVHRRATGWDKVVTDIQKALASQGAIGGMPTHTY